MTDRGRKFHMALLKDPEIIDILKKRVVIEYRLCKMATLRYREDMTFEDIGDYVGLSRERVRQIIHKFLDRYSEIYFYNK